MTGTGGRFISGTGARYRFLQQITAIHHDGIAQLDDVYRV